jgi:CheY-like chemotaxis protein
MEDTRVSEFGAVPQIVLIVEDEALIREDAAEALRLSGYRVHEAANASDAMDSLRSDFIVDLIFTDINLGKGLDGIELALLALVKLPRLKILVTTGGALKNVLPVVMGKILPKPYSVGDLLLRVKHALAA